MYLKQEMGNTSEEDLRFLSLVDIFEPLCPEEVEALGRASPEVRLWAGRYSTPRRTAASRSSCSSGIGYARTGRRLRGASLR